VAKKKPTKKKQKKKIPQTSDIKAARQALIQADLLGFEANRAELATVSKGAFAGVRLRAGGSGYSRYRIGKPKADKGSGYKPLKPPKPPRTSSPSRKAPTTRTAPKKTAPKKTRSALAKTAAAVRKRNPGLSTKEIRARARAIIAKRKATPKRKVATPRRPKPRTTPQNPGGSSKF